MRKMFNSSRFILCTVTLLCLFFNACASSYHKKVQAVHHAYNSGNYEKALKLMNELHPNEKDKVVYLMDKGMILHAAGKYEESNKVLKEAEDLSDVYSVKSASREVGSTLWSEEGIEYAGDNHERVMIAVIRMLNYIMLDKWNGALVEVRRVRYLTEKVYGDGNAYNNAFMVYMSALVWETLGQINDAFIDYKRLSKNEKEVPYYGEDLKKLSERLGLKVKYPPKKSLAWTKTPNYRKNKGQLIIILENGRSPQYISRSVTTGYFTYSAPFIVGNSSEVSTALVKIDGKDVGNTYSFYNIMEDIEAALRKRQKRTFVRKMIKMSVQAGLYTAGHEMSKKDETSDQLAGLAMALFGLSMSAADKADERSWRTLPEDFQIARFYLRPGLHNIEILPNGHLNGAIAREIEIKKGKPKVILLKFPEVKGMSRRYKMTESKRIRDLKEEEQKLIRQVRSDSKNGNLKLKLAKTRMMLGNYNVEILIKDGIRNGGDELLASKLMTIMFSVRGEYEKAYASADSYKKNSKEMEVYSNILSFAMSKSKRPKVSDKLKLNKKIDIYNAYNYFVMGLFHERAGQFRQATVMYSKSYDYGLIGRPVADRVVITYKRTSDSFKKSKQGIDIMSRFADRYFEK